MIEKLSTGPKSPLLTRLESFNEVIDTTARNEYLLYMADRINEIIDYLNEKENETK